MKKYLPPLFLLGGLLLNVEICKADCEPLKPLCNYAPLWNGVPIVQYGVGYLPSIPYCSQSWKHLWNCAPCHPPLISVAEASKQCNATFPQQCQGNCQADLSYH